MSELDPIDLAVHRAKVQVHRALRFAADRRARLQPARHSRLLVGAPELASASEQLYAAQLDPRELPLELGKVENLRVAARALHGLEFEAHQPFSFWAQVGPPLRVRGFVDGRELREGCVVPGVGGGLCLLSNGLYRAALAAEFEILERHPHSQRPPGSRAALGEDATVAWNYVDLRFVAAHAWRLEVRLGAELLHVGVRAQRRRRVMSVVHERRAEPSARWAGESARSCLSCAQDCSYARAPETAVLTTGRRSWLVDAAWPEYVEFVGAHAQASERLLQPIDGARLGLRRYAWPLPAGVERCSFPARAVLRSVRARQLAAQGPERQAAMLADDARLAAAMAAALTPRDTQLVVSQTLLPHLQRLGALGGRRVEVLMQRFPMIELQARLDEAKAQHPRSSTLADFRAPPELAEAEAEALAEAAQVITPHAAIAACFPGRARLLDWTAPVGVHGTRGAPRSRSDGRRRLLLPASTVGRKGVWELREALAGLELEQPLELSIAGRELEGPGFWTDLGADITVASGRALEHVDGVVLPAWIEHEPRVLLRALARGLPVIASRACGLSARAGLTLVRAGDVSGLREALRRWLELGRAEPGDPRGSNRRNLGG